MTEQATDRSEQDRQARTRRLTVYLGLVAVGVSLGFIALTVWQAKG